MTPIFSSQPAETSPAKLVLQTFLLSTALVLSFASSAWAISPATKCQAAKLTEMGKYGLCLFKAEARAVKTSNDPNTVACDLKLAKKWAKAEDKAADECPSTDEMNDLAARVDEHLVEIASLLAPVDDETLDNTVFFEGVGSGEVVMINGPGVQIERLLNYSEIHWDDAVGEVDYRNIVFEPGEDWASNLQLAQAALARNTEFAHDTPAAGGISIQVIALSIPSEPRGESRGGRSGGPIHQDFTYTFFEDSAKPTRGHETSSPLPRCTRPLCFCGLSELDTLRSTTKRRV